MDSYYDIVDSLEEQDMEKVMAVSHCMYMYMYFSFFPLNNSITRREIRAKT